jgi:superfamily II DNA or RNA helicase
MWPIQVNGVNQTLAAIEARQSPIVLCSPTGTGKTRMMAELTFAFIGLRKRVGIYCNRTLLIEQMSNGMKALGLEHDFRASEKPETIQAPDDHHFGADGGRPHVPRAETHQGTRRRFRGR